MDEPQTVTTISEEHDREANWDQALAGLLAELESGGGERVAIEHVPSEPLRCVSSGYLEHGCSCTESVPAGVAGAAWQRELRRHGDSGDRFFHFAWRGGVWLAFGVSGGCVRGVYCPAHSAQREERAFAAGLPIGS